MQPLDLHSDLGGSTVHDENISLPPLNNINSPNDNTSALSRVARASSPTLNDSSATIATTSFESPTKSAINAPLELGVPPSPESRTILNFNEDAMEDGCDSDGAMGPFWGGHSLTGSFFALTDDRDQTSIEGA